MKVWPRKIAKTLAAMPCLVLISCGLHDEGEIEKPKVNELDTIEVTGICETDGGYEPCPIKNIPRYLRQLIALDQEHIYRRGSGHFPATINSFVILDHIENGYLIENYIGYKYIKSRGNPGQASFAWNSSEIDPNATVYEIFTDDFDRQNEKLLGLRRPVEIIKQDSSCSFRKYSRENERVVVIVQDTQPDYKLIPNTERRAQIDTIEKASLNCSAHGHLYYFGIDKKQLQKGNSFYDLGNRISTEVIFNKEKIVKSLKEQG